MGETTITVNDPEGERFRQYADELNLEQKELFREIVDAIEEMDEQERRVFALIHEVRKLEQELQKFHDKVGGKE